MCACVGVSMFVCVCNVVSSVGLCVVDDDDNDADLDVVVVSCEL